MMRIASSICWWLYLKHQIDTLYSGCVKRQENRISNKQTEPISTYHLTLFRACFFSNRKVRGGHMAWISEMVYLSQKCTYIPEIFSIGSIWPYTDNHYLEKYPVIHVCCQEPSTSTKSLMRIMEILIQYY